MTMRFKIALTLALAILPPQLLMAQPMAGDSPVVSQKVTTTYLLEAGSAEAKAMQAWLWKHTLVRDGVKLFDAAHIGDIRITHTAVRKGTNAGTYAEGPPPPWMPAQGNPGDTYSVSTCSGGVSTSWSYEWVGSSADGGWVLQEYHSVNVRSCPPS